MVWQVCIVFDLSFSSTPCLHKSGEVFRGAVLFFYITTMCCECKSRFTTVARKHCTSLLAQPVAHTAHPYMRLSAICSIVMATVITMLWVTLRNACANVSVRSIVSRPPTKTLGGLDCIHFFNQP